MHDRQPNVILIAVDDYRDFVSCMSVHPDVKTPNIDRLAKQGVVFTNAHCQAPMCGPSRSSFLTGIRPSTSGCYGFQPWKSIPMLRDADTLPRHFRNNGYFVMGTGKIHHGSAKEHPLHGPDTSEWDVYWPSIEEPYLTFNGTVPKMAPEMGNLVYGVGDTQEEDCGDYQHATWAVSRLSQEYDRPFFLGVGFYKPHLPFVCPKAYFDLYDQEKLQGVLVKEDDLSDIPDAGRYLVNQHLNDYIVAHHMQKDILHAYLACVSYMDAQVGRILDALENSPHKDNTVVIFCGDNGWHFGEKHTWKKFTLWKEATRVPLILSCPGKGRDRFCSKPVGLMDIFPTVQEICGLSDTKQKLEGRSLVPLLEDPEIPWEVPVITSHGRDSYSLTTERWKYIRYFDGTEELYDRLDDGYEWNNLADKESSMRIKKELQPYIPSTSAANAPGSTHPNYFVTDYPNLQAWRKRQEEKK